MAVQEGGGRGLVACRRFVSGLVEKRPGPRPIHGKGSGLVRARPGRRHVGRKIAKRRCGALNRRAMEAYHPPPSGNGRARELVLETVTDPELAQEGDYGALLAIRLFPRTPLTKKTWSSSIESLAQTTASY